MDTDDVIKLTKVAVIIMLANSEKTITARTIQTAVRILYMDHPMLVEIISSGTRYVTIFTGGEKVKINSFSHYNSIVREHLGSGIYNDIYRVSATTIPYLCGIADKLNNQVQVNF
jgi:hypothetical protein